MRLVATGGTISLRSGAGRLTAEELVALVPRLDQYVKPEFEQFSNVSSSAMTLDQWLQLSKRLNDLLSTDKTLGGVVVTSGTDTLEELAYFLNLTVRDVRPVVVVGAMRNATAAGYEGPANLLAAFRVAAEPESRNKGVLVVLNDEINAARDVFKTDAMLLSTFQSRPAGVLGMVYFDRAVYYRNPVKRHTAASEFDVSKIERLPRVDVIMVYQGAPGDLIEAAVERGAKGIVLAAAAGSTSGTQIDAVLASGRKGVFVVSTVRNGGRIAARRGPRPTPAPGARPPDPGARYYLAGEDLQPPKARILLMLALTKTTDPDEIQRMFIEY